MTAISLFVRALLRSARPTYASSFVGAIDCPEERLAQR